MSTNDTARVEILRRSLSSWSCGRDRLNQVADDDRTNTFPQSYHHSVSSDRTFSTAAMAMEANDDVDTSRSSGNKDSTKQFPVLRQRQGVLNLSILAHVDHGVSTCSILTTYFSGLGPCVVVSCYSYTYFLYGT
jgi:hypothetical protein